MENRFGIKDFVLLVLVVALIISVWLAMKQYDRQWTEVRAIRTLVEEQGRDIRDLKQRPIVAGSTTGLSSATSSGPFSDPKDPKNPFARVVQAQLMPEYARGDWYVDGFGGNVARLTPLLSGDTYGSTVQGRVLEGLATRDPVTLQWQGLIASSWKVNENIASWQAYVDQRKSVPLTEQEILAESTAPPADKPEERTTYVQRRLQEGRREKDIGAEPDCPPALNIDFALRPEVRFSDDQPLDADDIVFTYNLIMNPKINAPRHRAYLAQIKRVEKLGPHEVRFSFAEPYFEAFELAASMEILAEHFYGKYKPEDFNKTVGVLFGTGPYKMADPNGWAPGQLIQLVRNDRYWGISPAFNRIVYREYTSDVPRLTAFRNGEIDRFGAFPEQFEEMKRDEALVARTYQFNYLNPVGGYRYVAWNQRRDGRPTIFADRRVRQAMTMLTDRQRLIDEIMLGYGVLATGPFNPQSKQSNPEMKPWPYDPERAKSLLREVGCRVDGPSGQLLKPDGTPFQFKLTYPSGNPAYERMVFLFKDLYAQAGILLEPDPLEWAVFTTRLENKDFDAITLAWSAGIETDIYQMFHSSQALAGGDNFMSYISPELDQLIEQARRTMDEPTRMRLWHRAHAVMHEDQPYTFLAFPKSLMFLQNRFHNVQLLILGLNPNEEWFVPSRLQKWTD